VKPDTVFKWLLIGTFIVLIILGLLDYFEVPFVQLNGFLFKYRSVLISLGTLFVILLTTIFATHLSNTSAEKRQEADRLLNAELKLSDFRQEWINVLRNDLAEIISISYVFFDEKEKRLKNLSKLKDLDARVRMRLNPKPYAELERRIDSYIEELVNCSENGDELGAFKAREGLARAGAKFLKEEWDFLKGNLDKLKRIQ
jgi:hypothetical protein